MPASSTKRLGRLVAGFWVLDILVAVSLLAAWFLTSNPSARAIMTGPTPTSSEIPTSPPSKTAAVTSGPLPSDTPTFTNTPSEHVTPTLSLTATLTPTPFSEGPVVIGYSVENRPLQVYRFGAGPTERLIIAGMHGGSEYNTVQLADQLIAYLQGHPETIPAYVTLFILEDLNPDGVARSLNYLGRANASGVDLNRNWDANWQKEWPLANCWTQTDVTGGKNAMSEPETKALAAFIQSHSIDAVINYHSAALGIFPGGLPPHAYTLRLAEAVAAVTTYPYPPVNTGCFYTGDFTDWADGKGIAALNIELTNHTSTDFDMNLAVLDVFLNWKR